MKALIVRVDESVSKLPQQDDHRGKLNDPEVVLRESLVPHYPAPEPLQPREQPLHHEPPFRPPQRAAILRLGPLRLRAIISTLSAANCSSSRSLSYAVSPIIRAG